VNSRRLIVVLYLVLFAAFGAGAGAMLLDARAEYLQLKQTEAANLKQLAEAQALLDKQKKVLERLQNDPAYVEKILRQRTYARPGDMIFRFEN
jgi:cell division protein FtsB